MATQRYARKSCIPHHADRGRAKALPSQHISLGRTRAQKAAAAPRESWWTEAPYATDRAAFMRKAEALFPSGAEPSVMLPEWVA